MGANVQYIAGGANFTLAVNWSEPPLLSQCQIITFLIWKTDSIAKLRIEFKSILLEKIVKYKRLNGPEPLP